MAKTLVVEGHSVFLFDGEQIDRFIRVLLPMLASTKVIYSKP